MSKASLSRSEGYATIVRIENSSSRRRGLNVKETDRRLFRFVVGG